jgi:hypothetical protein
MGVTTDRIRFEFGRSYYASQTAALSATAILTSITPYSITILGAAGAPAPLATCAHTFAAMFR